jgi:hypothetical protein
MKTITTPSTQLDSDWLLNQAFEQTLCVHLPNGRTFLLRELDEGDGEAAQISANDELMAFIFKEPKKTYNLQEAKALLGV